MARSCEDEYVFLTKNGKRLNNEAIRVFMKEAADAVGVNPKVRVSPHTCRHTFAHQQLKNGLDLYSLSRLLGHENISITQIYLRSLEDAEIVKMGKQNSVLLNM
jgi:integrase/recombinase XerD